MAHYMMDISNSNNAKSSGVVLAQDHYEYLMRIGKYSPENERVMKKIIANKIKYENKKESLRNEKTSSKEHLNYIQRKEVFAKPEEEEDLISAADFNMPDWAKEDPTKFWIAADLYEKGNRIKYHSFIITLPEELTDEENIKLVQSHCEKTFGKDFVYSYGIHKKLTRDKKGTNIHVHIMFSDRKLDGIERDPEIFFKRANKKFPETGGATKDREKWHSKYMYRRERKSWENSINKELEKHGLEKVSCETLQKQLELARKNNDILKEIYLDRPPVHCDGRILQKIDKKGVESLTKRQKEKYEEYLHLKEIRNLSLEKIKEMKAIISKYEEKEKEAKRIVDNFEHTQKIILNRCEKLLLEKRKIKKDTLYHSSPEILNDNFCGLYKILKDLKDNPILSDQAKEIDREEKIFRMTKQDELADCNLKDVQIFDDNCEKRLHILENLPDDKFKFADEDYNMLNQNREYFKEQKNILYKEQQNILKEYADYVKEEVFNYSLTYYANFKNIYKFENDWVNTIKNSNENIKQLEKNELEIADKIEKLNNSLLGKIFNKKEMENLKKMKVLNQEKLNNLKIEIKEAKEKLKVTIDEDFIHLFKFMTNNYEDKKFNNIWEEKLEKLKDIEYKLELVESAYSYTNEIIKSIAEKNKTIAIKENQTIEGKARQKEKENLAREKYEKEFKKLETVAGAYGNYLTTYLKLKNAVNTYKDSNKLNKIAEKNKQNILDIKDNYRVMINDLLTKLTEYNKEYQNSKKEIDKNYVINNIKKENIANCFSYNINNATYYEKAKAKYCSEFINELIDKGTIKSFYNTTKVTEEAINILESNRIFKIKEKETISLIIQEFKEKKSLEKKETGSSSDSANSAKLDNKLDNQEEIPNKKKNKNSNGNAGSSLSSKKRKPMDDNIKGSGQYFGKVEKTEDYLKREYDIDNDDPLEI